MLILSSLAAIGIFFDFNTGVSVGWTSIKGRLPSLHSGFDKPTNKLGQGSGVMKTY